MSTILSIDLGNNVVKLAAGEFKKSSLTVQKVLSANVPEYSIEKGRIKNQSALADFINDLLKNHNIKANQAVLTINAVGAVVRDIDLPNGKPKELEAMIRNEMVRNYHIDEADVIQFKAVDSSVNESGAPMTTYRVVSLDSELVEEYHEFANRLPFKSIALDINMNSIDKLFQLCSTVNGIEIKEKTILILDFGAKVTSVYLHSGGKQRFFRQLELGSDEIEKRIGDIALIQPSEVKKSKESGYNYFSQEPSNEKYYSVLKPFFYELTDELRTILRFYTTRYKTSGIDQIFLFGSGSQLEGLPEYLESNLSLPAERIHSLNNIGGAMSEKDLLTHLNAFGAMIRIV